MKNPKYIIPFNYERSRGWQVRIPIDFKKNPQDLHLKFFANKRNGGSKQAKNLAIEYRNQYLEQTKQNYLLLDGARSNTRIRPKDSKNSSGITGVRLAYSNKESADGYIYSYAAWEGYGKKDGKIWRKSFSVIKFGEKEAFKLACQARYREHGILYIVGKISDLPCRPSVPYEKVKNI